MLGLGSVLSRTDDTLRYLAALLEGDDRPDAALVTGAVRLLVCSDSRSAIFCSSAVSCAPEAERLCGEGGRGRGAVGAGGGFRTLCSGMSGCIVGNCVAVPCWLIR